MIQIEFKERKEVEERFKQLILVSASAQNPFGYFELANSNDIDVISLVDGHIREIEPHILREEYNYDKQNMCLRHWRGRWLWRYDD